LTTKPTVLTRLLNMVLSGSNNISQESEGNEDNTDEAHFVYRKKLKKKDKTC
jgi:hypothetical protein